MIDTYRCGNCRGEVVRRTVKCSNGDLADAWSCLNCGETWFPWQLRRDIAWQAREDARRQQRPTRRPAPESEAR